MIQQAFWRIKKKAFSARKDGKRFKFEKGIFICSGLL
jgi:hypothetical protein